MGGIDLACSGSAPLETPLLGGPSDVSEPLRAFGRFPPVHLHTSPRRIARMQLIRKGCETARGPEVQGGTGVAQNGYPSSRLHKTR